MLSIVPTRSIRPGVLLAKLHVLGPEEENAVELWDEQGMDRQARVSLALHGS